jgi:hypothetical protein
MITQDYLKQIFEYKDGNLYWKTDFSLKIKEGKKAGSVNKQGRMQIGINKKVYIFSRVVFLYHYGFLPKLIDHIDGNKLNNKIENLREATISQNNYNSKIPLHNTSKIKNVSFNTRDKIWNVSLKVNKKRIFIGGFKDLELANLVATMAREKYHGEFARHK